MALLSVEKRKEYFKALGFGEYNATNIKRFQKTAFSNSKEHDGIYGTKTDNALRHWYNVKTYTKNFKPDEFKCGCGGKYCTGYPTYMRKDMLVLIQSIRSHWNKPVTVTCGLRCKTYNNSLSGSINSSKHLTGQAVDFYQVGVTDTLANRKNAIKWIKKQPNASYIYGNGINSNGYAVKAPYMGSALHADVKESTSTTSTTKTSTSTSTTKKTTTSQSIVDKELAACKTQSDWMKNAAYKWESKPTVAKSKKKGTCVTYVACVLQRIGYLSSGQCLWHNGKGYGTGKVTGANSKMTVTYMKNKTLTSLKNDLKAGDIILLDDNKSGVKGSGGHIFILTGKWKGNDPYIWDNYTAKKGQKARTYSGKRKVLARVRLK